jgi:hypothetical protein
VTSWRARRLATASVQRGLAGSLAEFKNVPSRAKRRTPRPAGSGQIHGRRPSQDSLWTNGSATRGLAASMEWFLSPPSSPSPSTRRSLTRCCCQEAVTVFSSSSLSRLPVTCVIGRGGARKRRQLITLISVGWLPPYLRPSGAGLDLGTRVCRSLITPPRVTPHRGYAACNERSQRFYACCRANGCSVSRGSQRAVGQ